MSEEKYKISPVAEWKGVCIIEKGGNVPQSYKGKRYATDGFIYIARLDGKYMRTIQFKNERDAKEVIDSMADTERARYLSMNAMWLTIMKKPNPWGPDFYFEFDEQAGKFSDAIALKDGNRRIENSSTDSLKPKLP